MRAPPESLIPITGQPILAARSMILHIFSAMTSPSEPPKTVKSCEKTQTRRPSMVPWPVTTASPQGRFFSIPNSFVRWRTNVSSSWKEPGSSSFSIRSRAVYLPLACCFSTACWEAWWIAAARSSSSWARRSAKVSGLFSRIRARMLAARAHLQRPFGAVVLAVGGRQAERQARALAQRALERSRRGEGAAAQPEHDPARAAGTAHRHGHHAGARQADAVDPPAVRAPAQLTGARMGAQRRGERELQAAQRRATGARADRQRQPGMAHTESSELQRRARGGRAAHPLDGLAVARRLAVVAGELCLDRDGRAAAQVAEQLERAVG